MNILFIQMKMEYNIWSGDIYPYPDITNATRATAHWVYESEFQISFFFCVKKCLRGVWNEEKSIVVYREHTYRFFNIARMVCMEN